MIRAGSAAAIVLVLAACGGGSSRIASRTIVLDHSIGPVRLLEPLHEVETALGKGVTVHNDAHNGHYVRYTKLGVDVAYAPGPHGEVAFVLLTTSSSYRTRGGVGVGSNLHAVASIKGIKCYSGLDCQHGNTHNKPGTGFALRNGKVWRS